MEWNMPGKWRYPTEALWSDEKNQGVVLSADCHRHVMWFGTKHLNFLASVWHSKKWRKIIKITKDFLIANIYYSKLTFSGNTQSHTHKVDFFFFFGSNNPYNFCVWVWFSRHRHAMSSCHCISLHGTKSKHLLPAWERKSI